MFDSSIVGVGVGVGVGEGRGRTRKGKSRIGKLPPHSQGEMRVCMCTVQYQSLLDIMLNKSRHCDENESAHERAT